jgi:hypothetical protein
MSESLLDVYFHYFLYSKIKKKLTYTTLQMMHKVFLDWLLTIFIITERNHLICFSFKPKSDESDGIRGDMISL